MKQSLFKRGKVAFIIASVMCCVGIGCESDHVGYWTIDQTIEAHKKCEKGGMKAHVVVTITEVVYNVYCEEK